MNPFFQPLESYGRDYDIVGNWKASMVKAIALDTGDDIDTVTSYVEQKMEKDWVPQSPNMRALTRRPMGDRKKSQMDLLSYLEWVNKNEHVLAPNLVCYANPKIEESFLSGFIADNLRLRGKVKKEGQAADMAGNKALAVFCNLLQANYKIRNNSISGALSSPHNPLYYASSHTALTSVCRAITSYANACNEKFLASNRHYYNPEVTIENIAYITRAADLAKVQEAMVLFEIAPPSVDHVFNQVLESTRLYWRNARQEATIYRMISNMSPVERAAFSFIGDFHSLHQVNDKAMRILFNRLIAKPTPLTDVVAARQIVYKEIDDEDMNALAGMICSDWMAGKEVKKLDDAEFGLWAAYVVQIHAVMNEYKPFIDAFLSTDILPSSIHSLPTIVRRVVVGSDTDSSIFSTQRQVEWFTGRTDFSHRAVCAGAITSYMVCQLISNTLRVMSGQMAVGTEQLSRLGMKSEFFSKAQLNTLNAKTYCMDISAGEGNVYAKPKLEVKGVVLKSSKLPTVIRKESEKFMWFCLKAPDREGGISPLEPAAIMASVEHQVLKHLNRGEAAFLRTEQMKNAETYANPMSSPYAQYVFWNKVFGRKYGRIEQLPADGVKVNVKLEKERDIAAWADTLDSDMKAAVLEYCHENEKKSFTSILVPQDLLIDGCIPDEILRIMDTRKILSSQMDPFYMVAKGISMDIRNSKLTRLWHDELNPEQAAKYLPEGYEIEI